MWQLLKIEWMKVRHYRTFWLLSALYLVSIVGINYVAWQIQLNRPKNNQMADAIIGAPPFQFPEVWHTVSYMSSFLLFIPGLLIIISVTNEFSFKTHRQNIIDGWSRSQFILVKMVLTLVLAVVSTAMVFITAAGFGLAEGGQSFSLQNSNYIARFFVQALSYSAVALVFALMLKRSGIAIGVFFLYAVVIENMVAGLMNRYLNQSGRFLPLEVNDNLVPFPFLKAVVNQFRTETNPAWLLAVTLAYLALYALLCLRKFERDDL